MDGWDGADLSYLGDPTFHLNQEELCEVRDHRLDIEQRG
jgi:hypothetical protein